MDSLIPLGISEYTTLDPFGMITFGRSWEVGSGYRYGFNTQEQDDEVYGNGNLNSALFWEYDVRLGRRWNIDPKPTFGISSYSVLKNNPIANVDFYGDIVSYENFKSRVAVFLARQTSAEYKSKFIEMQADENITYNFNYQGVGSLSEEITNANNLPANTGGFVTKETNAINTYTIHFTKQNDPGTIGYSKWGILFEESYHLDDALGGKIFGGTNQSSMTFNDKNVLSVIRPSLSSEKDYGEVDAWIWKADYDEKPNGSIMVKTPNYGTIKFRVENTLIQQIHATKNLDFNERRNVVWALLYEEYTVKFQHSVSETEEGKPRKSFKEMQSKTGNGPYHK